MIGIIVSIFAFAVAVVLHPGATEIGLIIDWNFFTKYLENWQLLNIKSQSEI
jgi:hypothetical protein